ncbi:hypothetical protein [Streptomyces sp. NPDC005281]|uniref:hypothetical protein n=1 Tax=Streptomyces sp. NPDC005281 TaxID=3155712 RepID=UPI0033A4CF6E
MGDRRRDRALSVQRPQADSGLSVTHTYAGPSKPFTVCLLGTPYPIAIPLVR